MRNLFILHTQYNIILGASIALSKFGSIKNDLIVYSEFKITEEYKKRLDSVFDDVLFIRESFEKEPSSLWRQQVDFLKKYGIFKKSKIAQRTYSNVFLSQDRELDSLIYGYFKQKNRNCLCSDIEEDCYYSNNYLLNDPNYNKRQGRGIIQKARKLIFGNKYQFQNTCFFYGASSFFDDYYVLYPNLLRPQLIGRSSHEITLSSIVEAVGKLYDADKSYIPESKKYYLFFFDLLERYNDVESIKTIVTNLYKKACSEGALFMAKYHPRETDKIKLGDNVCEIPASIPAEKLLCDLSGKDVVVLGNATTAVIVANKLGFNSICIARIDNSKNQVMMQQMERMGICMPSNTNEI